MATEIKSRHATVSKQPYELYMAFVDMRNFLQFLPEDKRKDISADYDSIRGTVQGFDVGVRVAGRVPYSRIDFKDDGAPFQFSVSMFFDPDKEAGKTDFHIEFSAELNFMMKMLLGSRLQEALDKMVTALADASNGKMPEGFDPTMYGFGK
ncbi:MAG: hypothetical protein IAC29_06235 [Bacteroidetes bacterium]|uniref:Polyketide cyclase / dehydrase and lipid transport n=1 Tax=Candidatus Cryptobacteroides merdigallinarum TaxID=2840770 RepID=A0A9D9EKM2_9BACT|nr:hypothetical protein [Candidatus Cryptobacteroides merdigallinarum]